MGGMYKTKRALLLVLFSVVSFLSAEQIPLESQVPLGMAFDGKILWVADSRLKTIAGYDFDEKSFIRPKPISISSLRDLAFWYPYLVTAYPGTIALLNPLNGDVVERISVSILRDPVSIATNGDIAFILDRNDNRIYRYNLKEKNLYGGISLSASNPRGMTWFKGNLWLADKQGRAHKINPENGEIVGFIPLPPDSFGISFIGGTLYVSRPNEVRTIDYIETDNYVAASQKEFDLRGKIVFHLPWPEIQRQRESRLEISFESLPFNARQRHQRLKADPTDFRFQRQEEGESFSLKDFKSGSGATQYRLSGVVSLFDLTHIFHSENIKQYHRKMQLPESVLRFISRENFNKDFVSKMKPAVKKLKNENEGRHPTSILPLLKNYDFVSLSEEIFALRSLGIPAREAVFFDMRQRKEQRFLQVYIQPVGWVTRGEAYSVERPREFPVGNYLLELYYPETVQVNPPPRDEQNKLLPIPQNILSFEDLELAEREVN